MDTVFVDIAAVRINKFDQVIVTLDLIVNEGGGREQVRVVELRLHTSGIDSLLNEFGRPFFHLSHRTKFDFGHESASEDNSSLLNVNSLRRE